MHTKVVFLCVCLLLLTGIGQGPKGVSWPDTNFQPVGGIADDEIEEPMLKVVSGFEAADELCLTYETAGGGDFAWQTCSGSSETNELDVTITGIVNHQIFIGTGVDAGVFTTINALTEEVTPDAGDFVLCTDDDNSDELRKCDIGNFPGGGSPAFSTITGDTNTGAAMVVGTGASLAVSGTGTIVSTSGDSATGFFASGEIADAQISNTLTITNLSGTNTGNEPAADLSTVGVVELATGDETNTGTDATLAVTPDGLDDWTGSAQLSTVALNAIDKAALADNAVGDDELDYSELADIAIGGQVTIAGVDVASGTIPAARVGAAHIDLLSELGSLSCTGTQILEYNGSAWTCVATPGGGGDDVQVQALVFGDGSTTVVHTYDTDATDPTLTVENDGEATWSGAFIATGDFTGDLTGEADTATALAANPTDCSSGSYVEGIDAAGVPETCTDASVEIDSIVATHTTDATAHLTDGNGISETAGFLAVDLNATLDGDGIADGSLSGLEFTDTAELALLQGCDNGELLKWIDSTGVWACAADSGGAETNTLTTLTTGIATGEIPIGTTAGGLVAYVTLQACAADEKLEYTDGAPDTMTCEAISGLVDAAITFTSPDVGAATATTPSIGNDSTLVATTAFVQAETVDPSGDISGTIGGGLSIGSNTVGTAEIDMTASYNWTGTIAHSNATMSGGDSAASTTRPAGSNIMSVRTHDTDCTTLTDGKLGEVCVDADDGASFTCIPTAGDCSGAEWVRKDDGGAETNTLTTLTTGISSGEIPIGTTAGGLVAYVSLPTCASDAKLEYLDGAPDTMICEQINGLVDADITLSTPDLGTPSAIDLSNASNLPAAAVGNGLTDDQVLNNITIDTAGTANAVAAAVCAVGLTANAGNCDLTNDFGASIGAAEVDADVATQAEIDLKANLAGPTFTGTVTIPSPFTIGAVSMTSTGTELNLLDGITVLSGNNTGDVNTVNFGASIDASEVAADVATQAEIDLKANLAAPALTGNATTATTAAQNDSDTTIANTDFVDRRWQQECKTIESLIAADDDVLMFVPRVNVTIESVACQSSAAATVVLEDFGGTLIDTLVCETDGAIAWETPTGTATLVAGEVMRMDTTSESTPTWTMICFAWSND